MKAIESRNYAIFPGLTASLVNQHLSLETPTSQSHHYQIKYGIISNTKREIMSTVTLELAVHETCSKFIELLHLVCAYQT